MAKNPALKHRCGTLENYFASLCLDFPNCGVEMEWSLWGRALIRIRWVGAWHMVFVIVTWGKSLPLSGSQQDGKEAQGQTGVLPDLLV